MFPNTIMEAMACGTPCIGFEVGGIPEMIDHLHNGYVAEYKSSEDFANGIHWALSEGEYQSLSDEARRKVVSSYSENAIAQKHIEVYNKITGDYDWSQIYHTSQYYSGLLVGNMGETFDGKNQSPFSLT